MEVTGTVEIFKALAEESRLRILTLLLQGEMCVCEIEASLSMTQSNASRHLTVLKNAGIVSSTKRAQWTHYKIDENFERNNRGLLNYVSEKVALLPGYKADIEQMHKCKSSDLCNQQGLTRYEKGGIHMNRKVLFLCTSNSARSQMAEALLNHIGAGTFDAFSAGSDPAAEIHPMAVKVLEAAGFSMVGKKPKPLQEYIHEDFDFIITLCDRMKESCPSFPGQPIFAHWGMPDPADFVGNTTEKEGAFEKTFLELSHRIHLLINIPVEKLDRFALEQRVKDIASL